MTHTANRNILGSRYTGTRLVNSRPQGCRIVEGRRPCFPEARTAGSERPRRPGAGGGHISGVSWLRRSGACDTRHGVDNIMEDWVMKLCGKMGVACVGILLVAGMYVVFTSGSSRGDVLSRQEMVGTLGGESCPPCTTVNNTGECELGNYCHTCYYHLNQGSVSGCPAEAVIYTNNPRNRCDKPESATTTCKPDGMTPCFDTYVCRSTSIDQHMFCGNPGNADQDCVSAPTDQGWCRQCNRTYTLAADGDDLIKYRCD